MLNSKGPQKIITVCDRCLTESCWQGWLMCAEAQTAGTVTATEAEIAQMTPNEIGLAADRTMTFEEIFDLAACPYCKAAQGETCSDKRRKPYQGKPDDSPHPSRVMQARKAKRR